MTSRSVWGRRPAAGALGLLLATACLFLFAACGDQGEAPEPPDLLAPVVTLTAPQGGEVWLVGSVHSITWTASDGDTPRDQLTVELAYLRDGANATVIASGWPNSGSYEWTVPAAVSSQARIRLRVSDGHRSTETTSPLTFTVLEPPPPGQNLLAVGSASGRTGEGAEILLSLANENEVDALDVALDYDPAVVLFESATLVDRGAGRALVTTEPTAGHLSIEVTAGGAAQPIAAGAGSVVRLSFALGAVGSTPLTLRDPHLFDAEMRALQASVSSGSISVGNAETPANITRLIPSRTVVGDTLRVVGTEMGADPGEVRFTADGGSTTGIVLDWSPTLARVLVPALAVDGPVRVIKGTTESNLLDFSVAPKLISYRADLAAPGKPFQRGGCESCHFCSNGIGGGGGLCIENGAEGGNVAGILRGGSHGPAVIPRRSAESIMVKKLLPNPPFGDRMPQGGALRADEILAIQDWIDQGARDN